LKSHVYYTSGPPSISNPSYLGGALKYNTSSVISNVFLKTKIFAFFSNFFPYRKE